MSGIFWSGALLFVVTFCGLVFAVWYGMRGRGRNKNGRR
jgi:hypothetical protein